jgi:hypothetical protein
LVIDDALRAGQSNGRNSATEKRRAIPEQSATSRNTEVFAAPVDALDLPPIFDDAAFRNLRERLFGGLPPSKFPAVPQTAAEVPKAGDVSVTDDADDDVAHPPSRAISTSDARAAFPAWVPVQPTPAADSPPARRRGVWAVLGAMGVVIVAVVLALALAGRPGEESTPGSSEPIPSGSPGGPLTPIVGAATSTVIVGDDGSIQVEVRLVVPASVSSLTLSVPDPHSVRAAAPYRPHITGIEVAPSGSSPIPVVDLNAGSSADVGISGGGAITVTYQATGAVVRSEPSPPGRRAVLATPLTIRAGQPIMATVAVPRATNFGCWGPHASTSVVCGEATAHGWQVALTPERAGDIVIAQVNLPR